MWQSPTRHGLWLAANAFGGTGRNLRVEQVVRDRLCHGVQRGRALSALVPLSLAVLLVGTPPTCVFECRIPALD